MIKSMARIVYNFVNENGSNVFAMIVLLYSYNLIGHVIDINCYYIEVNDN